MPIPTPSFPGSSKLSWIAPLLETERKGSTSTTSTAYGATAADSKPGRGSFWSKGDIDFDEDAIATQESVFDEPTLAERYKPSPEWENIHRFDPSARWTWKEETAVIRKIDRRIMAFACIAFMALQLDRANLSQALSDNFLDDLGLTTDEVIMVNRVLRDDPSKGDMHNRQPITWKLFRQSLLDYDLWPLYIVGILWSLPVIPAQQYFTLLLRDQGFSTSVTNLLTIPAMLLSMFSVMLITHISELYNERALVSIISQIWTLVFLVRLYTTDTTEANPWLTAGMIGSNIYQSDDRPQYRRANRLLIGITCFNVLFYLLVKAYYIWRNKSKKRQWDAMSEREKRRYLDESRDAGNKRLEFIFAH
ncbi:unnamed protein product [Parascedosporium putredinis]|uniref:Phthalate transporter n=1 Tax=Parascedosporium putredinis TaxID=1442378 RepID=A0A9P1H310_9PEZI|nr:unnamed protein product [Parascedosporium putredinis]CAI7996547.1 unnamed protein product [Parascedosporium putredinis]